MGMQKERTPEPKAFENVKLSILQNIYTHTKKKRVKKVTRMFSAFNVK